MTRNALANAFLIVNGNRAYLRAKFYIPCHTEITWSYGINYPL